MQKKNHPMKVRRILHTLVMIRAEKWSHDEQASQWCTSHGLATQRDFPDKTSEQQLTKLGIETLCMIEAYLGHILRGLHDTGQLKPTVADVEHAFDVIESAIGDIETHGKNKRQ